MSGTKTIKDGLVGATGSVSGLASILGSWQVCHNLCLGLIAFLGVLGITFTGMPLLFFTKVAVPFWIAAVVLLCITGLLYYKKRCLSNRILIFNSGLVIVGIPFAALQSLAPLFYSVGGLLVLTAIILFVKDRREKRLNK